jgi:thioredoxin-like negative regulator of GroEL
VTVDYPADFDPLTAGAAAAASVSSSSSSSTSSSSSALPSPTKPPPAKIEDVVFEGTAEELQRLVIESPVPVLLDVYADWCGPCKQLTPALEQICVNAGGMLRLVKVNTDQQRSISGCLGVTALPTVFGMRDGRILNMFQGMPRDEGSVRDFLMGLIVPGHRFDPEPSAEERSKYDELGSKLIKLASASSFTFSSRERLQGHTSRLLDELVENAGGGDAGMSVADDSARALRSLLSNLINHPLDEKYRRIKLDNRVVASKIACHPSCMALLGKVGFARDDDGDAAALVVAKGKRVVNTAPFVVGRDAIDRWMDRNRHAIAAAGRRRRDEAERARLAAEVETGRNGGEGGDEVDDDDDDESGVTPTVCTLKLRLEGKKKTHDVTMDADETLGALMGRLPFPVDEGATVQFTCAARRLVVRSTDAQKISMTLAELKLTPAASVVVRVMGESTGGGEDYRGVVKGGGGGSLAERAASQRRKVTGSHSMHSIGLYAKDDGLKGETFESGGVLYEHVVSDDEGGDATKEDGDDGRGEDDGPDALEEGGDDTTEDIDGGDAL